MKKQYTLITTVCYYKDVTLDLSVADAVEYAKREFISDIINNPDNLIISDVDADDIDIDEIDIDDLDTKNIDAVDIDIIAS